MSPLIYEFFCSTSRHVKKVSIDDENGDLTVISCPANQEPIDQRRSKKTGKILAYFSSDSCKARIYQERCPVKIDIRKATLNVDEARYAGAPRHHKYMGNTENHKQDDKYNLERFNSPYSWRPS